MNQEGMNKEIIEIIERELPSATARQMKKFIEKAEGVQEQLDEATDVVKALEENITMFEAREAEFDEMSARESELNHIELGLIKTSQDIEARERNFELEKAHIEMAAMKVNMENMITLVSKVFGHPGVKVISQVPVKSGHYKDGTLVDDEVLQPTTETKTEGKE